MEMVELCSMSFKKVGWKNTALSAQWISFFFWKIYFVSNNILLKNQLNKSDLVIEKKVQLTPRCMYSDDTLFIMHLSNSSFPVIVWC